jgi:hypothetical protein
MSGWMAALLRWLRATWRAVKAALLRAYWRIGPVEEALRQGVHSPAMTARFAAAARRSARLAPGTPAHAALFGGGSGSDALSDRDVAALVLGAERVEPGRPNFQALVLPNLVACVGSLRAVAALSTRARAAAATPYDARNPRHEALLEEIWGALQPGRARAGGRHSADWQALGFQGSDPATDFRASGELGLRGLHRLATAHTAHAAAIVSATELPYRGYPLALASIHATMLAAVLAADGRLAGVLPAPGSSGSGSVAGADSSNTDDGGGVGALCDVSAHLLLLFDDAWADAAPPSVMAFEAVFARFRARVGRWLDCDADDDQDGEESSAAKRWRGGLPVPRRLLQAAEAAAAEGAASSGARPRPPFMAGTRRGWSPLPSSSSESAAAAGSGTER